MFSLDFCFGGEVAWVFSAVADWKPTAAVPSFLQTSDLPRSNVWPRQIWLTEGLQIAYSAVLFLYHSITGWETTQTWYPCAAGGRREEELSTSDHAACFFLLLVGCISINSWEAVLLWKEWLWGFFLMNFANAGPVPIFAYFSFSLSLKVHISQTYRDPIKHRLLAFALLHSKDVFWRKCSMVI